MARGAAAGEAPSGSPVSGTPAPGNSGGEGSASSSAPAEGESSIASPFKKHRASLPGFDENVRKSLGQALLGAQKKERGHSEGTIPTTTTEARMEEDEEL